MVGHINWLERKSFLFLLWCFNFWTFIIFELGTLKSIFMHPFFYIWYICKLINRRKNKRMRGRNLYYRSRIHPLRNHFPVQDERARLKANKNTKAGVIFLFSKCQPSFCYLHFFWPRCDFLNLQRMFHNSNYFISSISHQSLFLPSSCNPTTIIGSDPKMLRETLHQRSFVILFWSRSLRAALKRSQVGAAYKSLTKL